MRVKTPEGQDSISDLAADAAQFPAETSTGTVSRALALLSTLADVEGPATVKQLAEILDLPPSTTHRLLQLMRAEGFVTALPDRQYAVGNEFYRVAARIVHATKTPELALRFIESVASRFDETVLFGMYLPAQRAVCFAARSDGNQILKYQIEMHKPLSLVWGASGKAILAHLPQSEIDEIVAREGKSPAGAKAVPSKTAMQQVLQVIRSRGFAVTESEKLPGARGIAAPVFGPEGVLGCICLTSPKGRLPHGSVEEIGRMVASAARELSLALGAQ